MIEFYFLGMPIKTLGSLEKIRVGRVTGNTHIFFLALLVKFLLSKFKKYFEGFSPISSYRQRDGSITPSIFSVLFHVA